MSKKLTKAEVLSLARLARLRLTPQEVDRYLVEMNSILDYVELLNSADTYELKPTSQVTGLVNVYREDEIKQLQASPEDLMDLVPERESNYIKVKRMI